MDGALDAWFEQEVLAHEPALTRYIARFARNAADIQDVRQEIYVKVLEAAEKKRPPAPRYFLFAVARNLLTDLARRQRVVPIELMQDPASLDLLVDELSPERRAGDHQQLCRLGRAFDVLPQRCREVVWMKKIQGLRQKEIAQRLSIAEATVESHLVRGMRLLARLYYDTEMGSECAPEGPGTASDLESWRAG